MDFVSETPEDLGRARTAPWLLLIVDDDPLVHEATRLALQRERIAQRPLEFLHAYSAAEARLRIAQHPHIDALLLDVIMETAEAGLQLARELRAQPSTRALRILLRSGQPGEHKEDTLVAAGCFDALLPKNTQTRRVLVHTLSTLLTASGNGDAT